MNFCEALLKDRRLYIQPLGYYSTYIEYGEFMAHSLSARKRVRQIVRKSERNQPFRRRAANAVREARLAIEEGSDDAGEMVRQAQIALDKAARRRIIHPNAAARRKSRLVKQLKSCLLYTSPSPRDRG